MCCSVLSPEIVMHDDACIGGRSDNNIKCVVHDDLGWKNRITPYIFPHHWLYEWFSQFHRCGTYSVLSRSPSTVYALHTTCNGGVRRVAGATVDKRSCSDRTFDIADVKTTLTEHRRLLVTHLHTTSITIHWTITQDQVWLIPIMD